MERNLTVGGSATACKRGQDEREHLLDGCTRFMPHPPRGFLVMPASLTNPPGNERVDMSRQVGPMVGPVLFGEFSKSSQDGYATIDVAW